MCVVCAYVCVCVPMCVYSCVCICVCLRVSENVFVELTVSLHIYTWILGFKLLNSNHFACLTDMQAQARLQK